MIWIGSKKFQKKCFIIQDGSLIGKVHRAGLSLIIDLFNSYGEFLSQKTLKHFNVNMIFLDYAGLRKTVLKRN